MLSTVEVERLTGIEPAYLAWEASALPLSYSREGSARVVGRALDRGRSGGRRSGVEHAPAVVAPVLLGPGQGVGDRGDELVGVERPDEELVDAGLPGEHGAATASAATSTTRLRGDRRVGVAADGVEQLEVAADAAGGDVERRRSRGRVVDEPRRSSRWKSWARSTSWPATREDAHEQLAAVGLVVDDEHPRRAVGATGAVASCPGAAPCAESAQSSAVGERASR